jgi:hypothetical protein
MDLISILLASAVPIALIGGLINRSVITYETASGKIVRGRGIGWMDRNTAYALLAAAIGYAFGKASEKE